MFNEVGEVKEGEEAVDVWKRHFENVMNSEGVAEEYRGLENGGTVGQFKLLDEDMRKEVVLALGGVKRRVAAGRDGLTAEMVSCDISLDIWWCLFNWYWKFRMITTVWKKSVVVPIPKKQKSGPCRVDEFRGISLVAVLYKALCSIVQKRMMEVVEENGLVAEEQGGFRRGRDCRDQVLTLSLLGQIKAHSRRGIFAKENVHTSHDISCWGVGNNRFLRFVRALYKNSSCGVKVQIS